MRRSFFAAALLALVPAVVAAQIQPLPANPLLKAPSAPQADPLAVTKYPPANVVAPAQEVTDFEVATIGGTRTVTLSLEVAGPMASRFALVDPPSAGLTSVGGQAVIVQPQASAAAVLNPTAPSVRKLIRYDGQPLPQSGALPAPVTLTVVARDTVGHEQRRSFTVTFTRAAGPPHLDTIASQGGAAIYTVIGYPDVAPMTTVTLKAADGAAHNFDPKDPGSEVVCRYGSFRYACDARLSSASSGSRNPPVIVEVPDLGKGAAVSLILKNSYGQIEVPVTLQNTPMVLEESEFDGVPVPFGKFVKTALPGNEGDLREDVAAGPASCGKVYLVWQDVTASNPNADNLTAFQRAVSVRVIDKPAAGSDMSAANPARFEFDIAPGLGTSVRWKATYKVAARIGECAARKR